MLFSSLTFIFYFLPVTLVLYFICRGKARNLVLLAASLFFYWWGEKTLTLFMILEIVLAYLAGLLIAKSDKKKPVLVLFLIYALGQLAYFKYLDFFIGAVNDLTGLDLNLLRIALPIGISFYTFQAIGYVVDVYRGMDCERNILDLAMYVAMFPQLIAGPIVRFKDIALEIKNRVHSFELADEGIYLFVIGLSQKVLLANALGELCGLYRSLSESTVLFTWLYALGYMLQIYYDFAGYSNMAIGLGKIFGFSFLKNFEHPYGAASITDFWRRWHISLGSWFRDYVYIPLGGNRCSMGRHLFNIFAVWFLTGLWHGASYNFIIWGLYFGVLLVIEKYCLKNYLDKSKILSHIYVLFTVMIGFMIFDGENLSLTLLRITQLFGGLKLYDTWSLYQLRNYGLTILLAFVLSFKEWFKPKGIIKVIIVIILFVLSVCCLVDGSFNPFLYFRF